MLDSTVLVGWVREQATDLCCKTDAPIIEPSPVELKKFKGIYLCHSRTPNNGS
jgi:hypothetical protein